MAFGLTCKLCSSQETDHSYRDSLEYAKSKAKGFAYSLFNCPGYEPEDEELEAVLHEEKKVREKEEAAQRRRAFGVPDGL